MFLVFSLPLDAEEVVVRRIIDGDTLVIAPDIKVRLIGIDTPEIRPKQPFGLDARLFVHGLLMRAKTVRLESDGSKYDKYKRRLAIVYVLMPDNKEICLNEALLEQGLAKWEPQYRYSKAVKQRFQLAEQRAKEKKLNLWR